ncbi:MAG: CBS domain-containing protein [Gammaproteobacteria bacterium]|nr:CBS domain-containing protein [Gammaproteobacteria bacterium]
MRVADIMQTGVVSVELDDRLGHVQRLFQQRGFHHLLVVEEGRLFGILSDRDLLGVLTPTLGTVAESARDRAVLNRRVHQIMTRQPHAVTPQCSVMAAVDLMLEHGFSCIPVVDTDQKPVGVVTWRDLLRAYRQACPND